MVTPNAQQPAKLDILAQLPSGLTYPPSASAALSRDSAQSFLVTGATGFIGLTLVDALLRQSSARLLCLVRCTEAAEGLVRLKGLLQGRRTLSVVELDRLEVVVGDLAQERLGLSSGQWDALATRLDAIFHVGGWINFIYPFEKLKATNVDGTLEILKLAGAVRAIPVHFMSSLAVFFGPGREGGPLLTESEPLLPDPDLKGGYRRTKWVADALVQQAMQRGLPATILRPVRVTGHSQTGLLGDPNDLLFSLIRGCIRMKAHPILPIQLPMVPVDFVADVMVALAFRPQALGRAYHLIGAGDLAWEQLWTLIHACGYTTKALPEPEWWTLLEQQARSGPERRDFIVLKALLSAPNNLMYRRPLLDDSQLQSCLEGSGLKCPPIDLSLIRTYLRFLSQAGWLPPPHSKIEHPQTPVP